MATASSLPEWPTNCYAQKICVLDCHPPLTDLTIYMPYSRLHFRSVLLPPHGEYFPTSKIYRLLSVKFKFSCCNVHKPAVLLYNTAKILQNQHNRRHISLKLCQFLYEVFHFPLNKQSNNGSKCKHGARFHWAIFTYFSTIHVYF